MPFSITESRDADAVTLGLGIFGISPIGSPLDFTDVGYIKGASMTYNREFVEFESGGTLVKRLAFRDRLTMEVEMAEVSVDNLARIIPGNQVSDVLTFGGDRTITRRYVRFEHLRDDDKILQIDIYKTVASGEVTLEFAEEEFITFPTVWSAEEDTTKAAGERYGKISLIT